jgi:hypothetical protein
MRKQHPLLTLHEALAAAMLCDLSALPYQVLDREAIGKLGLTPREVAERRSAGTLPQTTAWRRPSDEDVDVVLFPQTWGSTAIGYNRNGGLAGAAMTPAYTVVVTCGDEACVYFGGGRLAYQVKFGEMSETQQAAWQEAVAKQWMPSQTEAVAQFGAALPQ